MSKSPILALVVVAALAAGTALIAGYVDGPNQSVQTTADVKCADCPKAGTEACCEVSGTCAEAKVHASVDGQSTSSEAPAAGCCPAKAEAGCCPAAGGEAQTQSPCGAGGCALPK